MIRRDVTPQIFASCKKEKHGCEYNCPYYEYAKKKLSWKAGKAVDSRETQSDEGGKYIEYTLPVETSVGSVYEYNMGDTTYHMNITKKIWKEWSKRSSCHLNLHAMAEDGGKDEKELKKKLSKIMRYVTRNVKKYYEHDNRVIL